MDAALFVIIIMIIAVCIAHSMQKQKENVETSSNNKSRISEELRCQGFSATRSLSIDNFNELIIDENSRQIAICHNLIGKCHIIPFSSIINVSIFEDGEERNKSGIGRAVVGGMIAGGVGAIVGASTSSSKTIINSLELRIFTNRLNNPMHTINGICMPTNKKSPAYSNGIAVITEAFAVISAIISQNV